MLIKKLLLVLALFATFIFVLPASTSCLWAQDGDTESEEMDEDIGDEEADEDADEEADIDEEADVDEDADVEDDEVDPAKIKAMKLQEQWEDMLHFINIARPRLAASYARAILANPQATPDKIYILSAQNPQTLRTLRRAENLKPMEKLVPKLRQKIEEGSRSYRADPAQIEESLRMMARSLSGMRLAIKRLQSSGEFAIPALLHKLSDPKTSPILRDRIVTMLHEMGRPAVRSYSVALQSTDAKLVEFLANALGQMEYSDALPRLREALERPDFKDPANNTRKALVRAIIACSGGSRAALKKPVAELFYRLGQQYYAKADSLLPDPKNESKTALVWFWKKGHGVEARPVPKQIFCDIYAMRMARLTLKHEVKFYPAVPLWLSACLRRQLELPAGTTDLLWAKTDPRAQYYVLASSPQYLQMVLARAMRDGNVAIAREVIKAMSQNTGAASLVKPLAGGARPLVSAMAYPDLTVRFLAAETLAGAMPTTRFTGDQVVMSLLGSALRQKGRKYAMLVVQDEQKRNKLKEAVRSAGFEPIDAPVAADVLIVAQDEKTPGLDVVIVGADTRAVDVVEALRSQAIFNHIPVVVDAETPFLRDLSARDGKMVLLPEHARREQYKQDKTGDKAVAGALKEALAKSLGQPLSEASASEWAVRAARAIRKVGQRSDVIFDLRRVAAPLAEALKTGSAELQTAAAQALAVIDSAEAQQTLVGLALKSDVDEKIRIVTFNAASESVRRFGNRCPASQAKTLVRLVTKNGSHELMQAAAQLLGALNLPSEQMPELILSTDKID